MQKTRNGPGRSRNLWSKNAHADTLPHGQKYVVGKNENFEHFKLESFRLSWNIPSEVKTFLLKLEKFNAVGEFRLKLES